MRASKDRQIWITFLIPSSNCTHICNETEKQKDIQTKRQISIRMDRHTNWHREKQSFMCLLIPSLIKQKGKNNYTWIPTLTWLWGSMQKFVTLLKELIRVIDANIERGVMCGFPITLAGYLVMALARQFHNFTDSCNKVQCIYNQELVVIILLTSIHFELNCTPSWWNGFPKERK